MAQGFTLNIDDKLLNNLITADKLVQQLGKSSEQTRDRFNKAFADMAQVGVDGLIRRLEEAKRKIDDMGGSVGSDKGLSSISTQATQSADTIQQLIQVITQLHTAVNKKQMSDALKIRPEDLSAKQIAALTKQMAKERIAAHIAASKTITQSVNTEQKTIVETVKASGKEEIQAIKNKTNEKIALQNSESKNIIETINAENRLAIQAIRAKTNEQLAQEKNASEQILAGYRVRKAAISDSARLEAAANKENTNTLIRYMKVMNMSELTADSRYKKLANLDLILKELQRDEAKFANEISKAKAKMEELSNAEGKAATSSARLSSMTMQEALSYSKNTKSINDQLQAIKALKAARANLSKEGLSDKQYRDNINKLTEEIKRQQNEVNKLIGKHQNLSNGLNKLGPLIAQVFSVNAIKNFVQKLVSVRGEYEQQHRAIQVLLQDYNKANNIWNKTIQLAVKSPYTIQQLTSYTKQLAAYRIESSKLYDTTKRLADVSVGLGVDMQRVVLAYGQVRAANFLRGTELRQFTEAGIPMLDELAKYFSAVEHTTVTAAQVFERISKRQVLFTDVDAVIKKMTDAGGVFYNMQEEMANTLKGMSANLKDKVFLMFNQIGTEQQGLLTVLIKLAGLLTEHWRTLSAVLTIVAIVAILKFTASIWASIASLKALDFKVKVTKANLLSLASTWKGLATIMFTTPWGLALTGIITVATGLFTLNQKTKAQNRELENLSANIRENISQLDAQKRKIEENNKAIKEGENITNKSADDENKLAKAREENARILADLKSKYPEYYNSIVQQKNGIIELTEAVEGYTDALAQQASIALLSKGGWFYDSLTKNSKDFTETLAEQQELLRRTKSSYESERIELSLEKSQGEISDSRYKKELKRLNDLIYITEEALNTITNFKGKSIKELEDLGGSFSLLLGDFSDVIQTIMSTIAGRAEDAWDNL
jgi:DNA repair exonuclease SbcCD ATPase subunit